MTEKQLEEMSAEEIEKELGDQLENSMAEAIGQSTQVQTDTDDSTPSDNPREGEDDSSSQEEDQPDEGNDDKSSDQYTNGSGDNDEMGDFYKTLSPEQKIAFKKQVEKKNKWKGIANERKQRIQELTDGDHDDEFEDQQERDLAIVEEKSKQTYAEEKVGEIQEELSQEINNFFDTVPHARENREAIEQIMQDHNFEDPHKAYTLYLAEHNPEKLYDVQKMNQKKQYGMSGSNGRGPLKTATEMSADELEKDLESRIAKGEKVF